MKKIAVIVVTYNRKKLLLECLDAINEQIYIPQCIFLIDNASTDGTDSEVAKYQSKVPIKYIRLMQNGGGAAGFYEGLKVAHESALYDGYWVMDDDGIPRADCLKNLVGYMDRYDYISPLVIAKENPELLSFNHKNCPNVKSYIANYSKDGIVHNDAFPFNGILYTKHFIDVIGYPKKELFIWGDEANYVLRSNLAKIYPITVINAIHIHPINRANYTSVMLFNRKYIILDTESKIRFYCCHRNYAYNMTLLGILNCIKPLFKRYIIYSYYLILKRKSLQTLIIFNKAFFCGIFHKLNGHLKYIGK